MPLFEPGREVFFNRALACSIEKWLPFPSACSPSLWKRATQSHWGKEDCPSSGATRHATVSISNGQSSTVPSLISYCISLPSSSWPWSCVPFWKFPQPSKIVLGVAGRGAAKREGGKVLLQSLGTKNSIWHMLSNLRFILTLSSGIKDQYEKQSLDLRPDCAELNREGKLSYSPESRMTLLEISTMVSMRVSCFIAAAAAAATC